MATVSLICNNTTIPLVYNSVSQKGYRLQYNGRIQAEETRVLTHNPDFGDVLPVRAIDEDRQAFFTLDVGSSTGKPICEGWDNPLDAIIALKRLVDGCNQQAIRYWIEKDTPEVFLRVQLDGSTNYTDHSVKWGFVDDGGAFYDDFSKSEVGHNITVSLRLAPYGEGESYTLKNELANGDMVADTNSDGLADGLTKIGGIPASLINNTSYLINGASQDITATAASEGWETATVPDGGNGFAVGSVWIRGDNISSGVTVDLINNVSSVQSKVLLLDDSGLVSDESVTGSDGGTWYKISVSGAIVAGTVKIQVYNTSAVLNRWFADGLYLQAVASIDVPPAWVSSCLITNRADGTNKNYIDVWGLTGDAPSLITHKIVMDNLSTDKFNFIVSRGIDGTIPVQGQPTWLDDDKFAANADWVVTVDAGRSNGQYLRYTDPGTGLSTTATFTNVTTPTSVQVTATTRAVYGIFRVSQVANTIIELDITTPSQIFDKQANQDVNTTDWELVFLGVLNGKGVIDDYGLTTPQTLTFELTVTADTAVTVDFDALVLFPVDDAYLIGQLVTGLPDAGELWAMGDEQIVITDQNGQREPNILGRAWTAQVGCIVNRFVYSFAEFDNNHFLDDEMIIELEVTPRTRHLLGTI